MFNLEEITRVSIEIIILIIITIVAKAIAKIIVKLLTRRNNKLPERRRKTIESLLLDLIKYITSMLFGLALLYIFGVTPNVIVASFGAVAITFGIAAKDLLNDILNGIFNIYEGYYDVGDYIEVQNYEGTVVACGIKSTTLKDASNETIIIPNSSITCIKNYTKDNIFLLLDYSISYDESLKKVELLIEETIFPILNEHLYVYSCEYMGVQNLAAHSVDLRIAVECEAIERYNVERFVNRELYLHFQKNKIEIPFNQLVIHKG